MVEHPSISLIPNGRRDKHSEGGHSAPVGNMVAGSLVPPFVNRSVKVRAGPEIFGARDITKTPDPFI